MQGPDSGRAVVITCAGASVGVRVLRVAAAGRRQASRSPGSAYICARSAAVAAAAPAGLAHGCIKAAAARRVRFAEVAYLRAPRKGEPGAHEERSVVFLVDASAAAAPDAAAAAALAGARGAAAAEAAAKAALAAAEAEARAPPAPAGRNAARHVARAWRAAARDAA